MRPVGTEIVIRRARPGDAAVLAELANALDLDQGGSGRAYSESIVRRDGFGRDPAVTFLIAERRGLAVGYAMFCKFYNSDRALRGLFLNDLYVAPQARREGLGRRLMAAVAGEARKHGGCCIWWGVYSANRRARAFYDSLGARDEDARIQELDGEAFASLADLAERGN